MPGKAGEEEIGPEGARHFLGHRADFGRAGREAMDIDEGEGRLFPGRARPEDALAITGADVGKLLLARGDPAFDIGGNVGFGKGDRAIKARARGKDPQQAEPEQKCQQSPPEPFSQGPHHTAPLTCSTAAAIMARHCGVEKR